MSCYFRHMKDILAETGVEIDPGNKKDVDRIIHGIMEVEYKDCPRTWKAIKEKIMGDEKAKNQFIKKLKEGLKKI
jgi:hypothetical protein